MVFNLFVFYLNAWRRYFDFSGCTSRQEFWMFMLAHCCVTLVFISVDIWLQNSGWFDVSYSLISLTPLLAIVLRRLHDIGRSGWWSWVFIIPVIGPFWLIYLLSQKGTPAYCNERGTE
ncbi:DUF805 domain-containing protein [Vibrio sp. VB16]|uniref:DUF805 domain-containing protein n=1 Tax=Vibrio sp. VB16 TaxID=2785746 RepID=UPI00189D51AE|nr:DUF805 domain-containing protein [Vibrio sp. VB16]UGA55724.1 DUF805 domain-containing protein [Vibrio sp. VB16]